jgi:predicted ribosomally synthesized peptide with nif11-like leader
MSVQNAAAFLDRMDQDTELQARAQNNDDAVRIGAESGTPFTLAELEQAISERSGELSPEEMQKTAGGRLIPR